MDHVFAIELNRAMPAQATLFKAFQKSLEIPIDQRGMARRLKVDVAEMGQPSAEHPVVSADGLQSAIG